MFSPEKGGREFSLIQGPFGAIAGSRLKPETVVKNVRMLVTRCRIPVGLLTSWDSCKPHAAVD